MADHLTFGLAAAQLRAYKYVPYGPVREVVPYLVRRAQENADALSGAKTQTIMMLGEVRRRLIGF
jgi:proline dehydrogenase